jgi:hypothetical protein
MARIVTYAHRYKRPPKKRKAVALEVPTIVATKRSRRPVPRSAAEAVSQSPRLHDGAAQPNTARSAVTTPPSVRKSAIVTAKRRNRIIAAPDADKEVSPSVNAFFARMIRPRGQ